MHSRWNAIGTKFQRQSISKFDEISYFTSVTSLVANAFFLSGLTEITIPSNITVIGESALRGCSSLVSVTLPSTITQLGQSVFRENSALTTVTVLGTTPPTLGSQAFNSSINAKIYVPSSSVDTYKSAAGWSAYASRIFAIE